MSTRWRVGGPAEKYMRNRRLVLLGLPRGMVVDLDDEVRLARQPYAGAFGHRHRDIAGRPASDCGRPERADRAKARIGSRGARDLPRDSRRLGEHQRVVHHLADSTGGTRKRGCSGRRSPLTARRSIGTDRDRRRGSRRAWAVARRGRACPAPIRMGTAGTGGASWGSPSGVPDAAQAAGCRSRRP